MLLTFSAVIFLSFIPSEVQPDTPSDQIVALEWLRLIVDQENDLSFKEVREMDPEKITPRRFPYITFKGGLWIIFDPNVLKGLGTEHQLTFLGNARIIDLYYHTPTAKWEVIKSGLDAEITMRSSFPSFSLPFSEIDQPIYVHLIEPVFPMIIAENKIMALNRQIKKTAFNSIAIGGLFIILLINLFRWVSTREKIFGLYSVYVSSFIIIIFAHGGNNLLYQIIPIAPYSKFVIHITAICLLNIMAIIYGIYFLQLKKNIPFLFNFARFAIAALSLLFIYIAIDLTYFVIMANLSIAITLSLLFTGGIMMLRRGHTYVSFYVVAYILFLVLHVSYILLRNEDTTLAYTATFHGAWAGFFVEALLLNLSLNRKIDFNKNVAETQYKKSQEELVQMQKEQNAILEKNVKERTQELEESNEELNETIKKLQDAQSSLVESKKMASLGLLSAGIGHEINNPLNYIKGGIRELERQLGSKNDDELISKLIGIVNEGADRASAIVKSLSHFSRETTEMDEKCDLNQAINHCLVILETRLKHKVKVNKELTESSTIITGNEGRLHQALMNLLSNAEQAIKDEGTISISTAAENGGVVISIADDGQGIHQEDLAKIMDPFFTTKSPGEGTGLGLSITYKIIEDHGGNISVNSHPGSGTTFKINLPQNGSDRVN